MLMEAIMNREREIMARPDLSCVPGSQLAKDSFDFSAIRSDKRKDREERTDLERPVRLQWLCLCQLLFRLPRAR